MYTERVIVTNENYVRDLGCIYCVNSQKNPKCTRKVNKFETWSILEGSHQLMKVTQQESGSAEQEVHVTICKTCTGKDDEPGMKNIWHLPRIKEIQKRTYKTLEK